jgi:hypothetical protein
MGLTICTIRIRGLAFFSYYQCCEQYRNTQFQCVMRKVPKTVDQEHEHCWGGGERLSKSVYRYWSYWKVSTAKRLALRGPAGGAEPRSRYQGLTGVYPAYTGACTSRLSIRHYSSPLHCRELSEVERNGTDRGAPRESGRASGLR